MFANSDIEDHAADYDMSSMIFTDVKDWHNDKTEIYILMIQNDLTGLRTRTVHCIQAHSVVDEKLCDAAVSFNLRTKSKS